MAKSIDEIKRKIANFSGITADSRKVSKDFIFVAVKGGSFDGYDFIPSAIAAGAKLIVGENDLKVTGAEYLKVKDSREALGVLASEFYGNPSRKLKIIGVTGTKGKSTTCHIIYHILTELGQKAGLISSIVAKIGDREESTGFHVTSPDVVSLHKFLKEMVDAGCNYAVIEVSSHGIDQKRIAGVNFDVAVLTNIAPEHLDYHKTFGEYKRVKMSFLNSAKIKIIAPKKTEINILPGVFNNIDAEAAVRVVIALGFDKTKALNAIKTFKLPEGRLEEIKNKSGPQIFIDFAHTPESLEMALKYLKSITKGDLIAVFGSAGERDSFKRPKMAKIASRTADIIILTAEDPRTEKVGDIIKQIRAGIPANYKKIYEIPDREQAIRRAVEIAKVGDTIGIFGKGHEKSMNLDGIHEIPWSDKKIVEKYL